MPKRHEARRFHAAGARPGTVTRRHRHRNHWRALACSIAIAFLIASCKKKPVRVARRVNPRSFASQLRIAAHAAGGDNVWIKRAAQGAFPAAGPDAPVEALATPAVFNKVSAALRRSAARSGVLFEARKSSGSSGETELTIRFVRGRNILGIWKLRRVPRILRAAIIIDDMGANDKATEELLAMPFPLTFSVLPHLRYSVETAQQAHRDGHEIMLHLPMEPIPRPGFMPRPGEVREGMDREQVDRLVESDIAAVPYVQGANNHEGSLATQDTRLMSDVMHVLAARRLYFIDSRTTGATVALQVARRSGLPSFFRSVFLDDKMSVNYTLGQLREFQEAVREQGMAIAIGHPHPTTIRALEEFLPRFSEADIELVPVSRLVVLPEARRLEPN